MNAIATPSPTVAQPSEKEIVQPRILIVDDDRDLVATLSFRLQKAGFVVFSAYDGQAGLATAFREKPHLCVLDVMMSYHDGFEVCAELKKGKNGYRPKVIIISAITQGTDRSEEACKAESGADTFFSKPFDAKRLIEEIKRLLAAA
ncbi:MAG: response regulator [Verrucomicrobiae bacterium]|nr:response regulator [Verrucomicrobiae bacterium]